jgi:DNA-binding FadR family transcriptional regulator
VTADARLSPPDTEPGAVNSRGRPHEVKLARRIARRMEEDILAAEHPVGSIYASETELRERYGVSRAVLREAIRLVEHHGLAVMRRGPYGGLVLRAPDAKPLTNAVVVYLEYVGTTVDDLLTVRSLLEPLAARLAAQNLTEEHIKVLRATLEEEQARGELAPAGRDLLHELLGRIGGNRVLGLFIDVLVELTARYAKRPPPPAKQAAKDLSAASDHAHGRIVDAIVAGNAMLAEHRSLKHLDAMKDWLLSTRQDPIQRQDRRSPDLPRSAGKEKLAEAVARRLMSEIAASGVAVGEIYGSEPDLQARFDVSRSAFREAVRLLEYHSVARMRRGPYGGLVVTRPDPAASIDAMAVYLEYEKVEAEELRVVRDALELGALELLIARYGDPTLIARTRAALQVSRDTPGDKVAELSHGFHLRLAELTGNPVVSLFLRILLTVWDRHSASPSTQAADEGRTADTVAHVHGRIVDAVLDGDLALARHRMHRHLQALDNWWQ